MNHSIARFLLASGTLLMGLFLATHAFAETWYVKSSKTKIQAEPSARSKSLGYLSAGQAVNVTGTEGKFLKVSVGGKQGYIFKFKLTKTKPAGGGDGGDLGALVGNQKMAASESSSASSIRGLSPVSEKYAQGKGISANTINAVKQMESFHVSDRDVEAFQEAGQLGPYAQ